MRLDVVSFDFDNTLGYTDPPAHITIATILREHEVKVDPEEVSTAWTRQKVKIAHHPLMEKKGWGLLTEKERNTVLFDNNRCLLEELGITSNLDTLAKAINDEWFAVRKVYPDVLRTFNALSKMNILIAILAGPSSKTIKTVLKSHNLLNYISCFATSDIMSPEFGPLRKKDGSAYKYLLCRMNVEPSRAMHIGDNVQLDGDVPKSLGMNAVLINRDKREDLPQASQVKHTVIESLSELLDFIGGSF